jgi:homoserine dehydrogenase
LKKKEIKIGILGLGTVGTGVAKLLLENSSEIEKKLGFSLILKKISDVDLSRPRPVKIPKEILTNNSEEIIGDNEIEIVAELIGGCGIAKNLVLKAIKNRKNIVTSNKELIARYGNLLFKEARKNRVSILFEGSCGGGIPILSTLRNSLLQNKILEIKGIVNGTTNYILTKMSDENKDFEEALEEAKKRGYAERNPFSDIEGDDAVYKISILSKVAFGCDVPPEKIYKEGIRKITKRDIEYAKELGYNIKLLAIAKNGENLEVRVHPAFVPLSHPLSSVSGVFNAIDVVGNFVGELMFYGEGAGSFPTASAVVSDMIEIAKRIVEGGKEISYSYDKKKIKNIEEVITKFYIRMVVKDQPGVLASIAKIFGRKKVSILQVVQKGTMESFAEIVWVTHKVLEKNFWSAIREIKKLKEVKEIVNIIRVEGE